MLPSDVVKRFLAEKQILGLRMKRDSMPRTLYFEVEVAEGPDDLANFSLGAATAQSATGTGWDEIQDSASRYWLEPASERVIYQFFFGVAPGQAWIYRQYPTGVDINSLIGVRAIGDAVGFVDGIKSPYRSPSPLTEMWSMKGMHPAFLGYNPYLEPSSITIRLNFFVMRYSVIPRGIDAGDRVNIAPPDIRARAVVRSVGGRDLIDIPTWVENAIGGRS